MAVTRNKGVQRRALWHTKRACWQKINPERKPNCRVLWFPWGREKAALGAPLPLTL